MLDSKNPEEAVKGKK
jgi:hypothetical protein